MAAIELGAPYWIYAPDRTTYVKLNDPGDPNFVGYTTDITGLDDAEVRENAQNVVAGDGGYNGPYWNGRRPWTMQIMVIPIMPVSARSDAQRRLTAVMNKCLRQDGFLVWTPSDGVTKLISFRKQQPSRSTTGQSNVQRNMAIAGVADDWRIYSQVNQTVSTNSTPFQVVATNNGDAFAPPVFSITGPIDAPYIQNLTTSQFFLFTALGGGGLVPAGYTLTINLSSRYPQVTRNDGADLTGYVTTNTNWDIGVAPGAANTFQLSSFLNVMPPVNGQTNFQLQWNNTYQ